MFNFYRSHSEGMGKVPFSQVSVCSHPEEGYPHPTNRGSTPIQLTRGTPFQPTGRGLPPSSDRGGGVPQPGQDWMGVPPLGLDEVPPQDWMGVSPCWNWMGVTPPPISTGLGYPPLLVRHSSIMSTCYAAGGMPLAFTQNFLVLKMKTLLTFHAQKSTN